MGAEGVTRELSHLRANSLPAACFDLPAVVGLCGRVRNSDSRKASEGRDGPLKGQCGQVGAKGEQTRNDPR